MFQHLLVTRYYNFLFQYVKELSKKLLAYSYQPIVADVKIMNLQTITSTSCCKELFYQTFHGAVKAFSHFHINTFSH